MARNDLLDLFEQLSGGGAAPNFGADAASQINDAYGPALAELAGQAQGTKRSGKQGSAALKKMYAELSKTYRGDIKRSAKYTGEAAGNTRAAYNQGISSIRNTYQKSANSLADMMSSLGIQAAAPDVLKGSAQDSAWLQGALMKNKAGAQASYHKTRLGDQRFYNDQSRIAKMMGKEARTGLMSQVDQRLAQIQGDTAGVYSSMAKDRVSLTRQLQDQYLTQQNQMASQLMQAQSLQLRSQQQQQSAARSAASGKIRSDNQAYSRMAPIDRVAYQASGMFGQEKAPKAMSLVQFVASHVRPDLISGQTFIQKVLEENRALNTWKGQPTGLNDSQLTSLANAYYRAIH